MADSLQAPIKEESNIKIFILYLVDQLNRPLDFVDIHDIVVQNGLVSSFDFCMFFPDLVESGHLRIENDGNRELYRITEAGKDVAENLSGILLNSTKERALNNAKLLLSLKKSKSDIRYSIEDLADGRCVFHIRYLEKQQETLSLSVMTDNRLVAEKMRLDFEERPQTFQRAILSLLHDKAAMLEGD